MTLLGLAVLLAFGFLQPAAMRRWPGLERYALPPSSRPPGGPPLPWDIPLPPVPPEPPAITLAATPAPVAELDLEYRVGTGWAKRGVQAVEETRARQRQASAFEQGYQQARQMTRDSHALAGYVRQQIHTIQFSPGGYQAASIPGTPAHLHHIDAARNAYILTDGREIDKAYYDGLTVAQRAALLTGR